MDAVDAVTTAICGLVYCEISWRRGGCGNLAGEGAGVASVRSFRSEEAWEISRRLGVGERETWRMLVRVLLRFLSLSDGASL